MNNSAGHTSENALTSGRLHPWFIQAHLVAARSGGRGWGLFAIVALLVVVAGSRELGTICLRLFADWPVPMAVLMAAVLHSLTLQRCQRLAHKLDTGWLATLPISRPRSSVALALVALLILLTSACIVLALLVTAALTQVDDHALGGAVASALSGAAMGTIVGLWTAMRRRWRATPVVVAGRREALFHLDRLNDPRLPHISDWQRRAALLRWRSGQGGHFWLIGAVLIASPSDIALPVALGTLLLAGGVLWLGLVLRASLEVAGQAHELLRPTSVLARRLWASSLRYPLFASVCAAILLSVGHALTGFSLPRALLSVAIPVLLCLPAGWKLATLTRQPR